MSIAITAFLFFSGRATEAAWFNDSWHYRKKLVVDNTKVSGTTNLTDFPVLVSLSADSDLSANAQSDGDDILFTDINGAKLDHEIESYSAGTLAAWVRVPTLLAQEDTVLYMYYGNATISAQENPAGVWDSSFVMVQHLEEAAGSIADSTSKGNNGTNNGATASSSGGNPDGAYDFEATENDYITFGDSSSLQVTSQGTLEAWVKLESAPTTFAFLAGKTSAGTAATTSYWMSAQSGGAFKVGISDGATQQEAATSTTSWTTGTWYYFTGRWNGSNLQMFVNGNTDGSSTSQTINARQAAADVVNIGCGYSTTCFDTSELDGIEDEVRISNTARSNDWIKTTYDNINSPGTFFKSTGSQEKAPSPVAWWKFDEGADNTCSGGTNDACDSSGNTSNDAANSGATWQNEDMCVSGKCLKFDGTDDVVTATNNASIDLNDRLAAGFTFQTWVRVNSDGEGNVGEILDKGTTTYLRVTNEGTDGLADLEASLDLATTDATVTVTNGITLNQWQLVSLTYTDDADDEITVYIDGNNAGTSTNGSGAPAADTNNLLIGGSSTANFHGFIDEFKVYKEERTAAQIKTDYTLGATSLHGASAVLGVRDYSFLTDGLVGYWKMDETSGNAADSSGNGTTLTDVNTVTFTGGIFANGGDFESTASEYQFAADNTVLSLTGSLTLAAWIKPESVSAGTYNIISKWDGANESYRLMQNADEVRLELDSSGNYVETSASNLAAATFYHVVGVYHATAATAKIYINGSEATITTTGTIPTSLGDDGGAFHLGAEDRNNTPKNFYDGIIDDARVYNRALSPAEVLTFYEWGPPPVGYWPLDENTGTTTVSDRSGNANNGTMNGSMTESDWVPGKFGNALDFDGSNDYISVGDVAILDFADNRAITINAWVNVHTFPTVSDTFAVIVEKGYTSADTEEAYFLQLGGTGGATQVECGSYDPPTNQQVNWTISGWNTNEWRHITCQYNGSSWVIYFDGVEKASAATNGPENNNGSVQIGAMDNAGTPDRFFDGLIDDVRIYNYARTQKQIIEDMNAGHPAVGSPVGTPVGYWKLDDAQGTTAQDSSSATNNNDLTLNTASWTLSGKMGGAWNGTGSVWLTRSDDDDFDFAAADNFSIAFWFKSDSSTNPASAVEYLLEKGTITNTGTAGYALYANTSGNIVFGIKDDAAWGASSPNTPAPDDTATSTSDIYDNTWHHIVATKTGTSRIDLYVDGRLNASDTSLAATATLANSIALRVADDDADSANSFNGDLDEVKIYRYALNAEDVKLEYNQGKSIVLGALSTESGGTTASFSTARSYCIPGDTATCNPPVGEWKLNENTGTSTTYDTSGNGYNGTLNSFTEGDWVPGKIGSTFNIDGTNSVTIANQSVFTSAPITIEAWVKTDLAASGDDYYLLMEHNVSPFQSWILYASDGSGQSKWHFFTRDSSQTGFTTLSDDAFTINTWYHIAATIDSSFDTQLFINGRKQADAENMGSLFSANSTLRIGHSDYRGRVDEVRIFDYVRSQAQIAWDYNRGAPIAYYKLDECQGTTANNSAPTASGADAGNDGTITIGASGSNTSVGTCSSGTSTEAWNNGTTGKRNASLDFDGTDDYVTIADNAAIEFSTNPFSISAWVKIDTFVANRYSIVSKLTTGCAWPGYSVDVMDTGDRQVRFEIAGTYFDSSSQLATGTWYHIVATRGFGGSAKIYINGKQDATGTLSGDSSSNGALTIGRYSECGTNYTNGRIDDVRIYNFDLTAEQVKILYNDGTVRFGPNEGSP